MDPTTMLMAMQIGSQLSRAAADWIDRSAKGEVTRDDCLLMLGKLGMNIEGLDAEIAAARKPAAPVIAA